MVQIAHGQLGYQEGPDNDNIYGLEYGWNCVPWCVIFLWWCFREAGQASAFYHGSRTASCTQLLAGSRVVPIGDMQPGDIVILTFRNDRKIQHCGLVVKAIPLIGKCLTIEGNTQPAGDQSAGGMVLQKMRYYDNIVAVIRPDWKEEEIMPDANGRYQKLEDCPAWAQATIQQLLERDYLRGYDWGLNLSEDMCRLLVILDRAGAFRHD